MRSPYRAYRQVSVALTADARVVKALALASQVSTWQPHGLGGFRIPSSSRPNTVHTATAERCTCEDASRGNVCKHRLAVAIYFALTALVADSQ